MFNKFRSSRHLIFCVTKSLCRQNIFFQLLLVNQKITILRVSMFDVTPKVTQTD